MDDPAAVPIPFEAQEKQKEGSLCGAACLSMVLRSFGIEVSQNLLWPEIGRPSNLGDRRARTHLICRAAQHRGLAGLIVKARDPWTLVKRCAAAGVKAILNHRAKSGGPGGHYTVLLSVTESAVWVHDPLIGPNQRIDRDEFLSLWESSVEVTGGVLVAIAARGGSASTCGTCGQTLPLSIRCRVCKETIDLEPVAVLGCAGAGCPQRLWDVVFCPACDWEQETIAEKASFT